MFTSSQFFYYFVRNDKFLKFGCIIIKKEIDGAYVRCEDEDFV